MNQRYLSQIKNSSMKRLLLREDNIFALEELLNTETQRLKRLQRLKDGNQLDFGDTIELDELRELFPKISAEVNDFLGISPIDPPLYGYPVFLVPSSIKKTILTAYGAWALVEIITATPKHRLIYAMTFSSLSLAYWILSGISKKIGPCYEPLTESVFLKKEQRAKLIPDAGHEYAHHVQNISGTPPGPGYSIFVEGNARGVERHISEAYREREDNEAFLYDISDKTVGEIKSVYLWMSKKLGKPVKESLLKIKTSMDKYEGLVRLIFRRPTPHAIGNALFSIYEAQQGSQICGAMIQGSFQFK